MYLSFQTIVDILVNGLKNAFLLDEVVIDRIATNKKSLTFYFKGNEQNRKYRVMLYSIDRESEDEKEFIITSVDCDLLIKGSEFFPSCIGSFSANGITRLNDAFDVLLRKTRFFISETREVMEMLENE